MTKLALRRAATALVMVTLGVSLAGCGGRTLSAGGVTVLVSARSGAGMDALRGGRLEVVGGCLGVGGAVVVWPHGTEVADKDPVRIEVPGYGTFGLGDDVGVAGGLVLEHADGGRSQSGAAEVGGVSVPTPCAAHDVFLAH